MKSVWSSVLWGFHYNWFNYTMRHYRSMRMKNVYKMTCNYIPTQSWPCGGLSPLPSIFNTYNFMFVSQSLPSTLKYNYIENELIICDIYFNFYYSFTEKKKKRFKIINVIKINGIFQNFILFFVDFSSSVKKRAISQFVKHTGAHRSLYF